MGIDSCTIKLDNPNNTYYSGETVSGTVNIQNDESQNIRGIEHYLFKFDINFILQL